MPFLNPNVIFFAAAIMSFAVCSVYMLIKDCRMGRFSLHYYDCRMRVLSAVMPLGLAMSCLFCLPDIPVETVASFLATGPALLLLCPARHEKAIVSYRYAIVLIGLQIPVVVGCAMVRGSDGALWCSLSSFGTQALLLWYLISRTRARYSGVRKLFNNLSIWHGVLDSSRFIYSMGLFVAMGLTGLHGVVGAACSSVMLCVLYIICYMRIMEDSGYIIGQDMELCIKEAIKGHLYERAGAMPGDEKKMARLFEKVKQIMETAKPYVDENFSLPELARMVMTNKVYLSRTINMMAGCNFRQFLNYYRISEAQAMIRKDPSVKLSEVQDCCGFRTHQTFESAFVRQCGEAPREFQERLRMQSINLS